MKLSDLSELDAIANVHVSHMSPFEAHMATDTDLEKEYSWFTGKVRLTLRVVNAAVVDQAIRTAEAACLSLTSVQARIDTYVAIVSVKSMTLGNRSISIAKDTDWSTDLSFIQFSKQLSNEQLQLVVEAHKAFQLWLDGQRQQLSPMA
jgi:hypothetical protein